jgi:hypothetical protein
MWAAVTGHVDIADNFHPYECGDDCPHCARRLTADHDPATCALCDPDYDGQDDLEGA